MRSNFQHFVSYYLGLHIQNPGLKEVDLHPSPEKGSNKTNMMKQGRDTQKKVWTHMWIPALREVDLEPSAKRGTSRTRALVMGLYSYYYANVQTRLKIESYYHITMNILILRGHKTESEK